MIKIIEVITKKDIRNFVDFPVKLYKNNPYFVPPLRMDEINMFNKDKNVAFEDCTAKYFLAYKDNKIAGRIAAIIQHKYNEKVGEKRIRFTRFDCIDDVEVAKALFDSVEKFASEQGMDTIHGPMGFNDLDREGMLVEGFDKLSTFETQYNYDYYPKLVEACGFKKEVDWLEFLITIPDKIDERIIRVSKAVMQRSGFKIATEKNKVKFINKYGDGIFEVLDAAYAPLYGVVPLTEKARQQIVDEFKLIININYVCAILDKDDKVIAFGLILPSMADAIRKSKGRLLPFGIFRMIHAIRKPKLVDAALIGVRPEYQKKGLNAIILAEIGQKLIKSGVKHMESNPELETNAAVLAQWDSFEHKQLRRRRSYVKTIVPLD